MRKWLVVVGAVVLGSASPAKSAPIWERMFTSADGTDLFYAFDDDHLVAFAELLPGPCSQEQSNHIDAADDLARRPATTVLDHGLACFVLPVRGLLVGAMDFARLPHPTALARALVQAVMTPPASDPVAARLPASWQYAPGGITQAELEPDRVASGAQIAYLEDLAREPPCNRPTGAPPDVCMRSTVREHRRRRGNLVLSIPLESETTSPTTAIVALNAWFDAQAPNSRARRPVPTPSQSSPSAPAQVEPAPAMTSLPPVAPAPAPAVITAPTTVSPTTPAVNTDPITASPMAPMPAPAASTEHDHPPSAFAEHALAYFLIDERPVRYEFLMRDTWVAPPIWVINNDNGGEGRGAWYRDHAFGGKIIEHGSGIIGRINAAFLNVGGGGQRYRNTATGEITTRAYPTVSAGPEASWSFDLSPAYWAFRADSWINTFFGWRFGAWNLRQLNGEIRSRQVAGSPTEKVLTDTMASYIQNSGGFELELLFRVPVRVPFVGQFAAELDAPILYMISEPLVAAGTWGESTTGSNRAYGGVPRVSATYHRFVGPISLHVVASIPSRILVIPWFTDGAQLNLEAGLAF